MRMLLDILRAPTVRMCLSGGKVRLPRCWNIRVLVSKTQLRQNKCLGFIRHLRRLIGPRFWHFESPIVTIPTTPDLQFSNGTSEDIHEGPPVGGRGTTVKEVSHPSLHASNKAKPAITQTGKRGTFSV